MKRFGVAVLPIFCAIACEKSEPEKSGGILPPERETPAAEVPAIPRRPPPISGGTLLIASDGRTAVAADPDRDRISIVDLLDREVRAEIGLEPGAEPGRAVELPGARAQVVL